MHASLKSLKQLSIKYHLRTHRYTAVDRQTEIQAYGDIDAQLNRRGQTGEKRTVRDGYTDTHRHT